MVTSSAVVGSSASRTFGPQARAIPIITRWFMPPESWWGYSFARRSGSGMRTSRSTSTVRSHASRLDMPSWRMNASEIWRPTVTTGFSDAIGSWKIIEISRPRTCCISASESFRRSRPWRRTAPPEMRPRVRGEDA